MLRHKGLCGRLIVGFLCFNILFITAFSGGVVWAAAEAELPVAGDQKFQAASPLPTTDDSWRRQVEDFTVIARTSGYIGADKFREFLSSARGAEGAPVRKSVFSRLDEFPVWLVIPLILLGGLALNLTPCVLPMIPVNLAIIGAGSQAGATKRHGFLLGTVYGLAIALAYGVLGVFAVITGATFGQINASPLFNLSIAIIFVILGLAMLDIFHIDFSRFGSRINTGKLSRGSFLLAFFMGGVSALLAGACVAPVVIAVLLLSAQQYSAGNLLGLFYPLLLGLGMALPWPLAGAGISVLPKPGKWMDYVKYTLGLFIILLAVYYGHLAWRGYRGAGEVTPVADAVGEDAAAGDTSGLNWHTDLSRALADAAGAGKPLFIDFWASWCKNCHVMERTTFQNAKVQAELEQFVLLKYQAENPGEAETKKVMTYFQVLGLPTYVVLRPKPD